MSSFAQILESRDFKPERHVVIERKSFADEWQGKPDVDFAIGLRKVSDADIQTARAEAAKFAIDMHDDREGQIEAFNDALMRWVVVRGTCDPNDVRMNCPIFEGSEENVRNALTSRAIRFLWDEIEKFHLEMSPLVRVAKEADFVELQAYLGRLELLEFLTPGAKLRFQKLAGYLLEEMQRVDPGYVDPEDAIPEVEEPNEEEDEVIRG